MTDFTKCISCGTVRDDLDRGLCCECYQDPEETDEIEFASHEFSESYSEDEEIMDEQRADARRRFRDENF